ncbi:hypothetical protein HED60_01440 [Planctomycetales bacterium ZRK34]|nr:hypothetical protein HED60_01440 [Planctomycetales bacterium ZRK34]
MRTLLPAVLLAASIVAAATFTPIAAAAENPTAACIQRTMKALDESTADQPAHVRVMFYGQSITAQSWTKLVQAELTRRFPTVQFEFRNAAIGGYTSPLLVRTADHDLYPWYPDLLFFHVYGPMDKYEQIIQRVREKTSAEVILWSSHFNAASAKHPEKTDGGDDKRGEEIRAVAEKYHCMFIDLRRKWRAYLTDGQPTNKDLLRDGVHLKDEGCKLYAGFINEELIRDSKLGDNPTASGTITTVTTDSPQVTKAPDGSLTLRFTGNRVVAVSDGSGAAGAKATVLLDGQPMDGVKELWTISRPSVGPARIWMPAINHIGFEKPLLEENWVLTSLPDSAPDGSKIHYRLEGSKTGPDGEGWSTERFVSPSGRAIIEPADWRVQWTLGYRKATLPEGFQVKWRSYPMFTATYQPQPTGARTVLMQGCTTGPHTLTLKPEAGPLGISSFVVNTPAAEK